MNGPGIAMEPARTCGAECLTMVYRSLGKEVKQEEIWPAISKPNRFGVVSSTTHLMCQDALNRGFAAVAFQARHPLQVLRICHNLGIHAILNHRLHLDAPGGHYSVLAGIDEQKVQLHGPSRSVSTAQLTESWLPRFANSEIVGNVLIVIAPRTSGPAEPCEFCHTPMPTSLACPKCMKLVALQPGGALGCFSDGCIARMWNFICCPFCDLALTNQASENANPSNVQPTPQVNLANFDLEKVFLQLDRFHAHIASIPGALDYPDLKAQLDIISTGKEKIKRGYEARVARAGEIMAKMAAFSNEMKEKEKVQQQKLEELNKPAPSPDGDALGQALLKNLGLI